MGYGLLAKTSPLFEFNLDLYFVKAPANFGEQKWGFGHFNDSRLRRRMQMVSHTLNQLLRFVLVVVQTHEHNPSMLVE